MKEYMLLSLKIGCWFALLAVLLIFESMSDRVHLIFSWMSQETMFTVGIVCIPVALISFIPAIWHGVLLIISYSIKFVREQSK